MFLGQLFFYLVLSQLVFAQHNSYLRRTVINGNKKIVEVVVDAKISSALDAKHFSRYIVAFRGPKENFELISAHVQNKNGVYNAEKLRIFKESESKRIAEIYLATVRVGDHISLHYKIHDELQISDFFEEVITPSNHSSNLNEVFEYQSNFPMTVEKNHDLQNSQIQKDGTFLLNFKLGHDSRINQVVRVASQFNLKKIKQELTKKFVSNDSDVLPIELLNIVKKANAEKETLDRINVLVDGLRNFLTYSTAGLDSEYSLELRKTSDVFRMREANCKEFTKLFVILAEKSGLHASPVLVQMQPSTSSRIRHLGAFNHAIAQAIDKRGEIYWVDSVFGNFGKYDDEIRRYADFVVLN